METLCIDLIDTKTEDENLQREDTKPGILYDSTILQDNGTKAMKNEHANEQFDLEGAVIKTELKCEIGDDSESVVWNRIGVESNRIERISN